MVRNFGDSPDTYSEPYFLGVEENADGTFNVDMALVVYNSEDDERIAGQYVRMTLDYDPYDINNIDQLDQEIQDLADETMALYPEGN